MQTTKLQIYNWEGDSKQHHCVYPYPCFHVGPFISLSGARIPHPPRPLKSCRPCVLQRIVSIQKARISFIDRINDDEHTCDECKKPITRCINEVFYTRNRADFIGYGEDTYSKIKNFKTPFPFGFLRFQDDQIHVKGISLPKELRRKIWWIIVMLFFDSIEFLQTIFVNYELKSIANKEANQRVYQFLKEKAF